MGKRALLFVGALVLAAAAAGVFLLTSRSSTGRNQAAEADGGTDHQQFWTCGMHPQVIQDHAGTCPICHMNLTPLKGNDDNAATGGGKQKKPLYWWDPMLGPSSISDKPGKSAMGMDLVPVYADEAGPAVRIDPTVVQNMGVRTAEVTRGPLTKTVRTVGMLKLPEPGLHDVSLKIGGWIDKLYADQDGMHVRKGEPLFELYSQDLQVAEQELISAVKSQAMLGTNVAPALRNEAAELVASSKRKLRLWDVAEEDIESIAQSAEPAKDVVFRSPATGHIEDKMIVQGTSVQPGMKLMRIADHGKMWLEAQVYEEQLPVVRLGQAVEATVDGIPGKTFKGELTFIYPHVDHMTRTLSVRATLENHGFELKPGMYATANIVTNPLPDAIQIPREAVIDTGTRQITFVVEGEGHFQPRKVRMGLMGDNDMVQIVEGLAPGDKVVTSGQFLMDVESRTTEAIEKLRQPAAAAAPMTMGGNEAASDPQTRPAAAQSQPTTPTLTAAYCPMEKVSWLQRGDGIANPYMGSEMLTCGEVTQHMALPSEGSDLATLVHAYLDLDRALAADKVDVAAITAMQAAASRLAGPQDQELRESVVKLSEAKGLAQVRSAFKAISTLLVRALQQSPK